MNKAENSQKSQKDEKAERKYSGTASRAFPNYLNDSKFQESSNSGKSTTTSLSEDEIKTDNFSLPRSHPFKFMPTTIEERAIKLDESTRKLSLNFDTIGNSRELMDLVEKLMEKTCILKGRILDSISSFQSDLCLYSNKLSSRSHSGEGRVTQNKPFINEERIQAGADSNLEVVTTPSLYTCFSAQSMMQKQKIINYSDLTIKIQKIQDDLEDLRNKVLDGKRKSNCDTDDSKDSAHFQIEEMRDACSAGNKARKQTKCRRSSRRDSTMLEDIQEEDDCPESKKCDSKEHKTRRPSVEDILCKNLKCVQRANHEGRRDSKEADDSDASEIDDYSENDKCEDDRRRSDLREILCKNLKYSHQDHEDREKTEDRDELEVDIPSKIDNCKERKPRRPSLEEELCKNLKCNHTSEEHRRLSSQKDDVHASETEDNSESKRCKERKSKKPDLQELLYKNLKCNRTDYDHHRRSSNEVDASEMNINSAADRDADKGSSCKKISKHKSCRIHSHACSPCNESRCVRLQDICKLLQSQSRDRSQSRGSKSRSCERRGSRNEYAESVEKCICEICQRKGHSCTKHQDLDDNSQKTESQFSQATTPPEDDEEKSKNENEPEEEQEENMNIENNQIEDNVKVKKCPPDHMKENKHKKHCKSREKQRENCSERCKLDRELECRKAKIEDRKKYPDFQEARRQSGGKCNTYPSSSKSIKPPNSLEWQPKSPSGEGQKPMAVSGHRRKSAKHEPISGSSNINAKSETPQKFRNIVVPAQEAVEENLPEAIKKCSGNRSVHEFFLSVCPEQIQRNAYRVNVMDRKTGGLLGYFYIDEIKFSEAQARGVFDEYLSVFVLNSFQSYKGFKTAFKHHNLTETDES